jgi:DNA-binding transcriptional MerR regulator
MDSFSIAELEQFSGIKAHTIRIWEQRYDALRPDRSEGNTRRYDGQQLRRLLNIVSLMNSDHKVSELCAMSDKRLYELVRSQSFQGTGADIPYEHFISQIIAAALEYNEALFDKMFSSAILRFGIRESYRKIVYQVLRRLGLMWSTDTLRPAHEHFITSLIRQKILTATDSLPLPTSKDTWLLFLPPDEFHETGLLFANFLLRESGHRVIYLGADVPFESLKGAAQETSPNCFLFFLVRKNSPEDDEEIISHLSRQFKDQRIYVACDSTRLLETRKTKRVWVLHSEEDLEAVIK